MIAEARAKMRAQGKRTTEATRQLFQIPMYDWSKDPKNYRDENNGMIPMNRCTHCGHRYVGWNQGIPFCNICHLAHVGDSVVSEEMRSWIGGHVRIPDDMTEAEFVIREKKRESDIAYNKKNQPIESDFKRAIDLA